MFIDIKQKVNSFLYKSEVNMLIEHMLIEEMSEGTCSF